MFEHGQNGEIACIRKERTENRTANPWAQASRKTKPIAELNVLFFTNYLFVVR